MLRHNKQLGIIQILGSFSVQQKNLDSFAGGDIKKYSIFLHRFFFKIKYLQ